jgi:glutathione-specific gamma-glutamylcyclotransferase
MPQPLTLTEDLVALTRRVVVDAGTVPGMVAMSDQNYEEWLAALLKERPSGPVMIFAYGSLIWKPCFNAERIVRATAHGWQRRFCLRAKRFRGTVDCPGLMMQIDRGGVCEGMAMEVSETTLHQDLMGLLQREMSTTPPSNYPRWIDAEIEGRAQRLLAFTSNPGSPNYVGLLPMREIAETIASACGHWGSCADYVRQTVLALEQEGIHDPYLWEVQAEVAGVLRLNLEK